MNTNINQGSAQIYQFSAYAERAKNKSRMIADIGPRVDMAVGESWYHQAAVEEDHHDKTVIVPLNFPH